MKTLYSFVGNVCSGKSTITKALANKHSIALYSIDEYRIKHNAVLISEEWAAWDDLKLGISKENIAILESSGISQNITEIYSLFDNVVIIMLDCHVDILFQRVNEREKSNYQKVPCWWNRKNEATSESKIKELDIKLKSLIKADYVYHTDKMTKEEIIESVSSILIGSNKITYEVNATLTGMITVASEINDITGMTPATIAHNNVQLKYNETDVKLLLSGHIDESQYIANNLG